MGGEGGEGSANHRDGHEEATDLPERHENPLVPDCRLDMEPLKICFITLGFIQIANTTALIRASPVFKEMYLINLHCRVKLSSF